jgi:hypothetical protein
MSCNDAPSPAVHLIQIAFEALAAFLSVAIPQTRLPRARLNMTRLERVFGIRMPNWRGALDVELDHLS